jgi:hypothetical protein
MKVSVVPSPRQIVEQQLRPEEPEEGNPSDVTLLTLNFHNEDSGTGNTKYWKNGSKIKFYLSGYITKKVYTSDISMERDKMFLAVRDIIANTNYWGIANYIVIGSEEEDPMGTADEPTQGDYEEVKYTRQYGNGAIITKTYRNGRMLPDS